MANTQNTPPVRITDPRFQYVPACATDVRKTFERIRAEQARAAAGAEQARGRS
jgi:hypothetical protein